MHFHAPDTSEEAFQKSSTELQISTAEILQSAVTLRESVEERQLSMAVTAKSFSPLELKKQVDEYQKSQVGCVGEKRRIFYAGL
jgi:hypothetical protein